ncbi:MAG: aspartate aminotransferase family protein [Terriglobales bacterium]
MSPNPATVPVALEESGATLDLYRTYVNPQWVRLLDVLDMNVRYTRASGAWLYTADGRRILDFLSGYCVHNTGHNHPSIVSALQQELAAEGPAMVQSHVPDRAGELGERLCESAGGSLKKAFFCSSGSEGVEAAIKFARAHTRRTGLVYAQGAFHGLTSGALSLMGDDFWRGKFGPMLGDTHEVPFNDLGALEAKLRSRQVAAFIVEPVQSEAGIRVPDPQYLQSAQELCRKHATLFVLDEVQTGLGRTGRFLAGHHYGVNPDIVILAKALSGGLIPIGAVLMTDEVYCSVYDSPKRSIVHTSTYSENGLAMRAGIATLDVIEKEELTTRSEQLGSYVRQRLREELAGYEMVREVRGLGLLNGIEFAPPKQIRLRIAFETFKRIHPGMFGQMAVMRLFREKDILTQMCGNNFMVLKVAPPLTVTEEEIERFVQSAREVVELIHSSSTFWSDAIGLARRVANL